MSLMSQSELKVAFNLKVISIIIKIHAQNVHVAMTIIVEDLAKC